MIHEYVTACEEILTERSFTRQLSSDTWKKGKQKVIVSPRNGWFWDGGSGTEMEHGNYPSTLNLLLMEKCDDARTP